MYIYTIYFQIIKLDVDKITTVPWSSAYILKAAQCGSPEDLDPGIFKPAEISYQIYDGKCPMS